MKLYSFVEPSVHCDHPVTRIVSEEDIIREYFPYWSRDCFNKGVDPEKITVENCIEQFLAVHWAQEIK